MDKNLNELISAEQIKLKLFISQTNEIKQKMIQIASPFIANWYEETAKNCVVNNAIKSKVLTDESIKQMKEKIKNLQNHTSKIAEEAFSRLWWPINAEDFTSWKTSKINSVEEAMRLALGRIYPILEEFNCLDSSEHWANSYGTRYPYSISDELGNELKKIEEEYNKFRSNAIVILQKIEQLVAEKKKTKAERLWDES